MQACTVTSGTNMRLAVLTQLGSNLIAQRTRRGAGNYAVVSPTYNHIATIKRFQEQLLFKLTIKH